MYETILERHFCAGHHLSNYEGKCSNFHGHNYKVMLHVTTDVLDKSGISIDFKELKNILDPILEAVDHKYLNELELFQERHTSAEAIAEMFYQQIKVQLPEHINIKKVCVYESDTQIVCYYE